MPNIVKDRVNGQSDADRLHDIIDAIMLLREEALRMVPSAWGKERARAYWHDYLGRSCEAPVMGEETLTTLLQSLEDAESFEDEDELAEHIVDVLQKSGQHVFDPEDAVTCIVEAVNADRKGHITDALPTRSEADRLIEACVDGRDGGLPTPESTWWSRLCWEICNLVGTLDE